MIVNANITLSDDNEQKFSQLPTDQAQLIFDWQDIDDFWFRNQGSHGKKSTVQVNAMPFAEALEIQTISEPSYDHYLRLSLDTPTSLKQDDIILISFYARTTQPNTDGVGYIGVNLQRSSDPWTAHMDWPLAVETEWQRYYVPFSVQVRRGFGAEIIPSIPSGGDSKTFAVGEVRFGLKFGYKPQTIQIADLKGVNYGSDLPGEKLPYTSMKNTADAVILSKELSDTHSSSSWTPVILDNAKTGANYLPDFSYAGYHFGEDSPPDNDTGWQVLNVTDFGAVPNDGSDDTASIRNALTQAESINGPVILKFPAGKFEINEILFVKCNNLIMRGAGSNVNGTILKVEHPMAQMQKPPQILEQEQEIKQDNMKTDKGDYYSPFSWFGGVIWIEPSEQTPAEIITKVSGTSQRGSHTATVNSTDNLEVGQVVQIRWYDQDDDNSILPHIFNCEESNLPEGFGKSLSYPPQVRQIVTIESIDGNSVTFKEPINHDIRTEWKPQIRRVGFVKEVGLEGFKIEFPQSVYAGHHNEEGYNAVYMYRAINSWVRNVEIVNSDSGIIIDNSKNITIKNVVIRGRGGHYSLMARDSDQVLFRDFEITAGSLHTPSFNTYCRTSVYTHGKISDAQLDQHNGMNHQNLWDDLELDSWLGGLWVHGGSASDIPTHGAFNVAWNLRFNPQQNTPARANDILDGPSAYLVGLTSSAPLMFRYGPNAYFEGFNKLNIAIPSLYEYQLNLRTGSQAIAAKPAATTNPDGDNALEVLFFNQLPDALNAQITAFEWNLGTSTKPNGALISTEKQFKHIFPASGVYHVWLRVKSNNNWSDWEMVKIALEGVIQPQAPSAPTNLRIEQ
ncbi:glycosyl hydrolase family 28-related protein [Desulfococcaceae bacterium HSG9]|nr:glycosyl hydrolase family 28-related protein [Desulfococcaceae bacterium HSG9]